MDRYNCHLYRSFVLASVLNVLQLPLFCQWYSATVRFSIVGLLYNFYACLIKLFEIKKKVENVFKCFGDLFRVGNLNFPNLNCWLYLCAQFVGAVVKSKSKRKAARQYIAKLIWFSFMTFWLTLARQMFVCRYVGGNLFSICACLYFQFVNTTHHPCSSICWLALLPLNELTNH